MKNLFTFAVAASALFAFAGCTKDAIEPNTSEPSTEMATITATTEQPTDDTRTSLSNSQVLWTEGDKILMMLVGQLYMGEEWTLTQGAGTTKGTFSGSSVGKGAKIALYPNIYMTDNDSSITIDLTKTQTYASGSFGNKANPMIAQSDAQGDNLAFKNLCGAIRLQLTGDVTVSTIAVTTPATGGAKIAGRANVAVSYVNAPTMEMDASATNTVSLAAINQTLDPSTPKSFLIVLPEAEYAPGVEFTIVTSTNSKMVATTKKAFTVERSKITPLASFDVVVFSPKFPDNAFRAYLKELKPGLVLSNEGQVTEDIDPTNPTNKTLLESITEISCSNKSITSMKGIEYITNLEKLTCSSNPFASLDLTANTSLSELSSMNGSIIDIKLPESIEQVWLQNNILVSLNTSGCLLLGELKCSSNKLTSLTLSTSADALVTLDCYSNQLASLDVSMCPYLASLNCYENQLTSLTLPNNSVLTSLQCYSNRLSTLDLTKNTTDIGYPIIGNQKDENGANRNMAATAKKGVQSPLQVDQNPNNANATLTLVD